MASFARRKRPRGCGSAEERDELVVSFDHLVGALLQKPRHVEAEGLSGLEVDDQLELGRLHDGQIA
jgi:hypothetical protein